MARLLLPASVLALAATAPAAAQMVTPAMIQPIPGTTDADRLAAQMRLLAVNAYDLSALLAAGELSLKLDDLGAAASFFARAEKVDPRNGRAKAGEASILVHAERPGEALRYFALAESYGLAPAAFAADRGLAYDLLGEQERAQRDYRLALRAAPEEETQRRYALSLAIAGKRELAEQQLQQLLRKSDRGAWRAHAFVLALGGNVAEASRIATTMMPPGTAAGLLPFLERLPTLAPVDRAFAVHFGEVRSTPERLADARLVPSLPTLGADPYAPRLAATALPAPLPVDKSKRRGKAKREPVQVAVATPAPEPLPQTPGYRTPVAAAPVTVVIRAPTAWPAAITSATPQRVTLASSSNGAVRSAASPIATVPLPGSVPPARMLVAMAAPPARNAVPPVEANVVVGAVAVVASIVITAPTPPPIVAMAIAAPPPAFVARSPAVDAPAPVSTAAVFAPSSAALVAPALSPTVIGLATSYSLPSSVGSAVTTPLPITAPVESSIAAAAPRHDNLALAAIVAGLPIPAAELGVTGPVRPIAAPSPSPPVATPAVDTAATQAVERAAAAKALADKRAADRKAAADKKALAEKKAAAEKKAEEGREAAAQKKLERANPGRIWVQVAGGANAGDLPKAWATAKAKGGELFAGHATGWTTPLRFTNRVLAGPFKTEEEARAFVNKLKPKGVTGFTFTSEAGQAVTKLSAE